MQSEVGPLMALTDSDEESFRRPTWNGFAESKSNDGTGEGEAGASAVSIYDPN